MRAHFGSQKIKHILKNVKVQNGLTSVIELFAPGVWFIVLDLKDVYFHISIHQSHRKYLWFRQDCAVFQYASLPFSLATALKVFTKYVAVVVVQLHTQGCSIFMYLDGWIIVTPSHGLLNDDLHCIISTFRRLGLMMNWEKSHLEPSQQVQVIGAFLNATIGGTFLAADFWLEALK